ncbi:MAG: nucleotidyltransferase [Acetivibrionales bacterium]|jgi:predicted nucleotidyltransferase
MKVVGIVAEYNPFHNGHLYHVRASRELAGADCVVAVMSGNYTQRGEPAIVDKWARAEMALLCGIDLVIELPVTYAMASAEFFACGAVRLLDSLGVVNMLCFGSESGKIEKLSEIASILLEEPEEYKNELKALLAAGKSFPSARQAAISAYIKSKAGSDKISETLRTPNNILGIEYIKAIRRLNSGIVPMTVGRIGNDYNQGELSGEISSATSIRNTISQNPWNVASRLLASAMPSSSLDILEREIALGRGPVFSSDFGMVLLSLLRKMTADEISALPYMEEGLENRIALAAKKSGSFGELLDSICTRRYPATRIQRILFSVLTGLTGKTFENFNKAGGPAYIRVLGFNHTGRKLLASIRDKAALPVIIKTADYINSDLPGVSEMLALEAGATDQYVLGFKNPHMRASGSEFTRNVIYLSS